MGAALLLFALPVAASASTHAPRTNAATALPVVHGSFGQRPTITFPHVAPRGGS